MQVAHSLIATASLPSLNVRPVLRDAGIALSIAVACPFAHAEAEYPSAQDLVALVEVVGVECVRLDYLKADDVAQMRRNLPRHFYRATYAEYLASPAYERSAKAMRADVAKDGVTQKFCEGLRSFATLEPGNMIFAERGLDYPEKRER